MRRVLISDLLEFERHLLRAPLKSRASILNAILHQADIADRFRKRTGRRHPDFGDGTIAGAISASNTAKPTADFGDGLDCMMTGLSIRTRS